MRHEPAFGFIGETIVRVGDLAISASSSAHLCGFVAEVVEKEIFIDRERRGAGGVTSPTDGNLRVRLIELLREPTLDRVSHVVADLAKLEPLVDPTLLELASGGQETRGSHKRRALAGG
jgi:hypothetical protein